MATVVGNGGGSGERGRATVPGRQRVTGPELATPPLVVRRREEEETVVTFPALVYREFLAATAITGFLMLVSTWVNAPLLQRANTAITPNPAKAPWYFLGLQELLSRFPPLMAGVAFPTFVIVLMILVPFLDRNPSRRPSERKVAIILFALYMVIVVGLVIIGTFFRGHEFIWNWGWVLGNPQTCGGTPC
jgi:menaquinol-cytochrome c reductase cytochrome b/c subunit